VDLEGGETRRGRRRRQEREEEGKDESPEHAGETRVTQHAFSGNPRAPPLHGMLTRNGTAARHRPTGTFEAS
jgi:hypothetical protein